MNSIFRRETTKSWLQTISILLPMFCLSMVFVVHKFTPSLFIESFLFLGTIYLIIVGFRLFVKADKMHIEVFDSKLEWSCFLASPQEASIPISTIDELLVYKTKSNDLFEQSASVILSDGNAYLIPVPTGSVVPILKALRVAKPDLKETIKIGMNPDQKSMLLNLILGRSPKKT